METLKMLQKAGINARAPPSDYGEEEYDQMSQIGMSQHGKNMEKNKNNDGGNKINQTPSKGIYCRYREFMKMP